MMLLFYNIIQLFSLIIIFPFLLFRVFSVSKYRGRIIKRFGFGITPVTEHLKKPRIWIHALSVGEVSSAIPLVKAIRHAIPDAMICFSSTTSSGEANARKNLTDWVDVFYPFPLDIIPSVKRIINAVSPDIFILVETDFWPNFLFELKNKKVPALLVNGRISSSSFKSYERFGWFFLPLFKSFEFLSMQTSSDVDKIISLGVDETKVRALGNLKYESVVPEFNKQKLITRESLGIPAGSRVIIAGSTHKGEEEILLSVYRDLKTVFSDIFLIIAPRNIERGTEISNIAQQKGFSVYQRSGEKVKNGNVLILDTLGELSMAYSLGEIAFVGGSLIDEGGHNPLEPAVFGRPVIFGKHMEDFLEIAIDLVECGCAVVAKGQDELHAELRLLLESPDEGILRGEKGRALIKNNSEVIGRHIAVIKKMLTGREVQ